MLDFGSGRGKRKQRFAFAMRTFNGFPRGFAGKFKMSTAILAIAFGVCAHNCPLLILVANESLSPGGVKHKFLSRRGAGGFPTVAARLVQFCKLPSCVALAVPWPRW